MPTKYTRERLEPVVEVSVSIMEVMRRLGLRTWSGGAHNYIRDKIRHYKIDTSHFTGQGSNRGAGHRGGSKKLGWREVLVLNRHGRREQRGRLKRAMLDSGIPHCCAECGCGPTWNKKPLTFHIDHANGNRLDNRRRNVRFLCPNCHSQTPTYGGLNAGKIRSGGGT